ncbi:MAG: hypothetical protein ACI9BW_003094 [Gammaproteobacteria bacterium]|jgi:hypothetical protein
MHRLLFLALIILLTGCDPVFILPGGKLGGDLSAVPDSWPAIDDVKTIQLETNVQDPYSVNIWAITLGSIVYVHAGDNRSTWVENMEADPNVRIRVDGKLFELKASRVTSADEFKTFSDAYEKKYGSRPRNENVAEAYLFRLEQSV